MQEKQRIDILLARQCLKYKGCHCENKDCKNTLCPLHFSWQKAEGGED